MEDVRDAWQNLDTRSDNVFTTWEWATTWWRHFGRSRRERIVVQTDDRGGAVVILPLYLELSCPLRVLRLIGHGPADELGPICAAADERLGVQALREFLARSPRRWDVFIGERLPAARNWTHEIGRGGRSLRRESSPTIVFEDGGWDAYLASRSGQFRQQLKRKERRLAAAGDVRYRLCDDRASLDRDLDTLFALHQARWGNGSIFTTMSQAAFHRDFAHRALERGWLRLWLLQVDGAPVAALYTFRYANVEWYYQGGRDPAWDKASVGTLLLAHSVRVAAEDGVAAYRLLRGGEAYKGRFANHDPGVETIAFARGPARPALAAAAHLDSMSPMVRRLTAWAAARL